jgi:hypothetical protein
LLRYGGISAGLISQKAVVGLHPDEILGRVIWLNPDMTEKRFPLSPAQNRD